MAGGAGDNLVPGIMAGYAGRNQDILMALSIGAGGNRAVRIMTLRAGHIGV